MTTAATDSAVLATGPIVAVTAIPSVAVVATTTPVVVDCNSDVRSAAGTVVSTKIADFDVTTDGARPGADPPDSGAVALVGVAAATGLSVRSALAAGRPLPAATDLRRSDPVAWLPAGKPRRATRRTLGCSEPGNSLCPDFPLRARSTPSWSTLSSVSYTGDSRPSTAVPVDCPPQAAAARPSMSGCRDNPFRVEVAPRTASTFLGPESLVGPSIVVALV